MESAIRFRQGWKHGYTLAVVLLLIMGGITYRSLARLLDHEAWVQHTHIVLTRLESVVSLLKDAELGQRGYLMTGEDSFLAPMQQAQARMAQKQRALDSLTADNPAQQRRLDTLRALVAQKFAMLQHDLATYQEGGGYQVANLRRSKALMEKLCGLISRLQAEEERLLVLRQERTDQYARLTFPLTMVLSLCLVSLASWRAQRSQASKRRERLESRARFAQLLEIIPHMTWTSLPDGTVNYFNKQWAEYVGLSAEQLLASGVRTYLHPDDQAHSFAAWQRALQTGEPLYNLHNRWRKGETGEYRWHLAQAVPLRHANGEIVLWVGTNTDIHAQQLQQQELALVNTDLDNFIYTASHDLKAPISNIEALLTVLREELLPRQEHEMLTLLGFMQEAVERFKHTIGQMTEVVKLQKAQHQPATRVALEDLAWSVWLDLAPLRTDTNATLDLALDTCPFVTFSEKNLRSILYNLLSNALKYGPPDRAPYVRLRAYPHDSYAVLSVQDNGLGLDLTPAREQKLFGLFQRLHDHVEGSGMGLYMVKKIIDNAGGRIEVESQLGVGSTFRVYLPQ